MVVRVGFRRGWAVAHIVVGVAGLVVAWPFEVWWQSAVSGGAAVALATGVLRLFRPYFEYDPAAWDAVVGALSRR